MREKGFTLVELMVVISIIAILAVVGMTLFNGIQKGARDAKRKADVVSMAKAYETNMLGGKYQSLSPDWFASGNSPKPPTASEVDYFHQTNADGLGFRACTALENSGVTSCSDPVTPGCFCIDSQQGVYMPGPTSTPGPTATPGGPTNTPAPTATPVATNTPTPIPTATPSPTPVSSCDPGGVLSTGLLAYWKLDNTVNDSFGGHNGTWSGTAGWASGKLSNAGSFNGADAYVITDNTFGDNLAAFTVAAWIYPTAVPDYRMIVSKDNGGTDRSWWFGLLDKNTTPWDTSVFRLAIWNGATPGVRTDVLSPSGPSLLNTWTHVAAVYNGSTVTLYRNGVAVGTPVTVVAGNITGSTSPVRIGAINDTRYYFTGSLDDVRVYNRALSSPDIGVLANYPLGCAAP